MFGQLKRVFTKENHSLHYIVENADWSIRWDGIYITENLKKLYSIKAKIDQRFERIKRSLIHFGSRNIYLPHYYKKIHRSNRVVFTWFHGTPQDHKFIQSLPEGAERADVVHTSCLISKQQLLNWGVKQEKIRVIPLGVDNQLFHALPPPDRQLRRRQLGIPDDAVVVGSFQKDGNGWGEGMDPKLIKGPDIFCEVVQHLWQNYPVFVLLTGPARGYVKNRLNKRNIRFKHVYLHDYQEIANYYNLLDLYIVSSRAEGGPKAILESMASGVPVVSTRVGMAPDIIINGENGFLADIEDVSMLTKLSEKVIEDSSLSSKFSSNGISLAKEYDWPIIAKQYYEQIYSKLL